MVFDNFAGNWTYRSFVNRLDILPELDPENIIKDDVEKWSRYMFGQGLMVFHPTITGGLDGVFHMGDATAPIDMKLKGKIESENGTVWIRWNACGIPNTITDGWLYEYEGNFVEKWPNSATQIETIVGSVIRSQPHSDLAPNQTVDRSARAGTVASFILVRNQFVEARTAIPLPDVVLRVVGSEHYRLHHALWHGLRDNWKSPSDGEISDDEKAIIDKLGWAPPRPNQKPTRGTVSTREADNGAGEDFLFMHRQMILHVNNILIKEGLPKMSTWASIPSPNRDSRNSDGFSVPPSWRSSQDESVFKGLATIKSDEYWMSRMTFIERQLTNHAYLATLTLDQLGAKIEWLVHNLMHIRWCSQQTDPETGINSIPMGRPTTDRSQKWINSTSNNQEFYYDDLNDTFSSHVHPIFWRLHGWVDDRIDDWFSAHEVAHPGEVIRIDYMDLPWFEKGTWVACNNPWIGPMGMMHNQDDEDKAKIIEDMRSIYDLIFVKVGPVISKLRFMKFSQRLAVI